MYFDEEYEKKEKQREVARKKQWQKNEQDRLESNNKILTIPEYLTEEEKEAYMQIVEMLKESINYRLSTTDVELIWQYCQIKIMRDRSWREYNKNPDRYIRIVTGICSDGKTPKVMVKENEHYKTLQDCNKHLEKILKDLRLTPEMRRK
ncbi:MAG: P27 family phage terminase small subunit [Clostridia bacterium]